MAAFFHILLILTGIYGLALCLFTAGLILTNRRRQDEKPLVSVIVAARNEEKNVGTLLSDLARQTYPQDRIEIIVVNDLSEDRTGEVIREYAAEIPSLKSVRVERIQADLSPKKNAVNLGIRNSSGEIILTTDADCRVLPTWVETIVSYFTPDVGMIVGFSQLGRPGDRLSLLEKFQAVDFLSLMAAAQGSLNIGWPLAASGQNLAYRRCAFDRVGGFSRIGKRISGDDVLFLQLIRKFTSWKIRFAPSETSFNTSKPEPTIRGFWNQRIRWASNGAYQWRLNKPFFVYVLITFLVNLGLLLSIPAGILAHRMGPLLICLALKFMAEGLIVTGGSIVYNRTDLLKSFPFWLLIQIPYVVLVGFIGTAGGFSWKGRKASQGK